VIDSLTGITGGGGFQGGSAGPSNAASESSGGQTTGPHAVNYGPPPAMGWERLILPSAVVLLGLAYIASKR